jgi:hypothetical protein
MLNARVLAVNHFLLLTRERESSREVGFGIGANPTFFARSLSASAEAQTHASIVANPCHVTGFAYAQTKTPAALGYRRWV